MKGTDVSLYWAKTSNSWTRNRSEKPRTRRKEQQKMEASRRPPSVSWLDDIWITIAPSLLELSRRHSTLFPRLVPNETFPLFRSYPHTRPYGLLVNEACVTRNWPKRNSLSLFHKPLQVLNNLDQSDCFFCSTHEEVARMFLYHFRFRSF